MKLPFRSSLRAALFFCTGALLSPLNAEGDYFVGSNGVTGAQVDATLNGGTALSTNWTFSAWIHPTEAGSRIPGSAPVAVLTSQESPDATGASVEILLSEVGGTQRLELSRGSEYLGEPSTQPVPLNTWTHVAVTVSSTRAVKYYINGQPAGDYPTQYSARNVALGASGSAQVRFMGNMGNRKYLGGMDEVQVWKIALSPSQVQDAYFGKPPTAGEATLAAWFRFDQGSGATEPNSDTSPVGQPPAALADGVTWTEVPHSEYLVTTGLDEDDIPIGDGTSLREAVREAVAGYGPATITFAPSIGPGGVVLQDPLSIPGGGRLSLDATALPGGITIKGTPAISSTLLFFGVGSTATLSSVSVTEAPNGAVFSQGILSVTDGTFTSNANNPFGDILSSQGSLELTRCVFSSNSATAVRVGGTGLSTLTECDFEGNSASSGAALFNQGQTTLTHCRLTANSSDGGGALFNQGTMTLVGCSLTGNTANIGGGAAFNQGTLTLRDCVIAANQTPGGGGGFYSQGALHLTNCTLHGNLGDPAGAIVASGPLTVTHCTVTGNASGIWDRIGTMVMKNSIVAGNMSYDLADFYVGQNNFIGGNPLLGPLGDYGGPTLTLVPLAGSPVIDAALEDPAILTDQRGFPRVVDGDATGGPQPDIGAYETGTWGPNFQAYTWETLPADIPPAQREKAADFDADGQSNEAEWLALTKAEDPSSVFSPSSEAEADSLVIRFPTAVGRSYQLRENPSLEAAMWIDTPGQPPITGDGTMRHFTIPPAGVDRQFYQVVPFSP